MNAKMNPAPNPDHHSTSCTGSIGALRRISAVLACGWLLTGCATVDYFTGEERLVLTEVSSLEEIDRAQDLEFRDGNLIVANRGSARGIAVVDTGTGLVLDFYSLRIPPLSMKFDSAGRVLVPATDYENHGFYWIDLQRKKVHKGDPAVANFPSLFSIGDAQYLIDNRFETDTKFIRRVTITPDDVIAFGPQMEIAAYPTSVAFSNGKLFASYFQSTHLTVHDTTNLGISGAWDSVSLAKPGDSLNRFYTYPGSMTAHGGSVFVVVNRDAVGFGSDSSYIAVIDASTRTTTGFIPLYYRNVRNAFLDGNILYLCGVGMVWNFNGDPILDGGVEAIDLSTRTHRGVVVTEATLGGNLGGFIVTGPGRGYAIATTGPESLIGRIRKVSF